MNDKDSVKYSALHALRGYLTPVPSGRDVSEILREIQDFSGISFSESPEEISEKATHIKDSRVTFISLDYFCSDLMVTMLVDIPFQRLTTEDDIFRRGGYALAYVYNNDAPWFSEYGNVVVAKQPDGFIKRVG